MLLLLPVFIAVAVAVVVAAASAGDKISFSADAAGALSVGFIAFVVAVDVAVVKVIGIFLSIDGDKGYFFDNTGSRNVRPVSQFPNSIRIVIAIRIINSIVYG